MTGRGGTGSFISEEGLIITNWHVSFAELNGHRLVLHLV